MSNGIELKHPFVNKCPDIESLLKKNDGQVIQSIESFCAKIKQQAEVHAHLLDPNDYKGWALELFVEYLIKVDGRDNRIGIYDYQVDSEGDEDDVGVDGHGIGDNSYP